MVLYFALKRTNTDSVLLNLSEIIKIQLHKEVRNDRKCWTGPISQVENKKHLPPHHKKQKPAPIYSKHNDLKMNLIYELNTVNFYNQRFFESEIAVRHEDAWSWPPTKIEEVTLNNVHT